METAAMTAQSRLKLSAVMFAVLWTAGMIWWSGDTSIVRVAILSVAGVMAGLLWYWFMAKWQRWMLERSGDSRTS
jgi:hypothetical protein